MTVAAAPRFQNFVGNGTTGPFTFNFRILISNVGAPFITVTRLSAAGVPTILNYPADYAFSPVALGQGGGVITTTVAVANDGSRLFVEGATPVDQGVRYANQGDFFPETHELSYDKLTMIAQEAARSLSGVLRIPSTDITGTSVTLPSATQRAGQALIFDASGNVIVGAFPSSPVSVAMQPVLAAATLALARTAMGVVSIIGDTMTGDLTVQKSAGLANIIANISSGPSCYIQASLPGLYGLVGTGSDHPLLFSVGAAERGRINSSVGGWRWTIKGVTDDGVSDLQAASFGATIFNSGQQAGMRNRIVNGAFEIHQRPVATYSVSNGGVYAADCWQGNANNGGGVFSMTQGVSGIANYGNIMSLLVSTPDASVAAGEFYIFTHHIEGNKLKDLNWGGANAAPLMHSFWIASTMTGAYTIAFRNQAQNRTYLGTFTVNASSTYEYKTIAVPGDTTGTWTTDNNEGLSVTLALGAGSTFRSATTNAWQAGNFLTSNAAVNPIGTNGTNIVTTGWQLERGVKATTFERLDTAVELARCMRYYWEWTPGFTAQYSFCGVINNAGSSIHAVQHPVPMRVTPALGYTALADFRIYNANINAQPTSLSYNGNNYAGCIITGIAGGTVGHAAVIGTQASTARLIFDAGL